MEGAHGELTKINCVLNSKEYQEISNSGVLPKLPIEATNIKLAYEHFNFLGDFSLHVIYDVPLNVEVKTIEKEGVDWSENQSFETVGSIKRVSYSYFKI